MYYIPPILQKYEAIPRDTVYTDRNESKWKSYNPANLSIDRSIDKTLEFNLSLNVKCRDGNSRGRSAKELRGIRRKFRAIKLHASSLRNHAVVHHDFATVPQFKRHTTITIKKRWSVLKAPRLRTFS